MLISTFLTNINDPITKRRLEVVAVEDDGKIPMVPQAVKFTPCLECEETNGMQPFGWGVPIDLSMDGIKVSCDESFIFQFTPTIKPNLVFESLVPKTENVNVVRGVKEMEIDTPYGKQAIPKYCYVISPKFCEEEISLDKDCILLRLAYKDGASEYHKFDTLKDCLNFAIHIDPKELKGYFNTNDVGGISRLLYKLNKHTRIEVMNSYPTVYKYDEKENMITNMYRFVMAVTSQGMLPLVMQEVISRYKNEFSI